MNKSSKSDRPPLHVRCSSRPRPTGTFLFVELPMPGRLFVSRTPCPGCRCTCACKSHMRLSQIRMTPCNRFKTSPTKENRYHPYKAQPAQPRPISHTAKPSAFGPLEIARSLALSPLPLHAFHQATRFSKRSSIGSKRRFLFSNHTTSSLGMPDSPGRKGYKERSGVVAVGGCHHVLRKRLPGDLFRNHVRPSSSHGSSSYRTNERDEGKKKKKRLYKGNGWYQVRPKL